MHLNRLCPIILLATFFLSAQTTFSQVLINEYSCANLDQFLDNYGSEEDWIELYNAGATSVNIGGYHLSDNENKPTKWAIPAGTIILAKNHRIFWASGRDLTNLSGMHTNFRMTQTKNNPETILFADPNGSVLDAVQIKKTKLHQSRGRITDGAPEWAILTQPTPDLPNDNSPHFSAFADRPDINLPAGFYSDSIQITLLNNEPGALLYYTLDGAAHLRDAYIHNLAKRGDLHLDLRLSEKAIVYIDGQYWGVYDLRELPDDHDYTEYYYGQGKYEIQYLLTWGDTWAEYGGQKARNDWNALYNYIQSKPMDDQSNFDYVDSLLDVKIAD